MLAAANRIASILRGVKGATDVKVEQVAGLPFLDIRIDKAEIARRGLSVAAVQDVIGTAIGGQEAGVVFEGDRRFDIVVRLPEAARVDRHLGGPRRLALVIQRLHHQQTLALEAYRLPRRDDRADDPTEIHAP